MKGGELAYTLPSSRDKERRFVISHRSEEILGQDLARTVPEQHAPDTNSPFSLSECLPAQAQTSPRRQWCQLAFVSAVRQYATLLIRLTYAKYENVTNRTRTRALRSQNPTSPVSGRCRVLQNRFT